MSSVASSSKPKKTKTSKPTTRKRKPPVNGAAGRKVSVFDAGLMDWQTTGKDGLSLKIVREDKEKGLFLGAVGFEPMVRSGLHQHLGVATSFFAAGGLTDYSGSAKQNDFGINLKGATHDAVTYEKTVLISRLEGPVVYPESVGSLHGLHTGAFHGHVENENPDAPPDLFLQASSFPTYDAGVNGVTRQTVFDYSGVGDNHRWLLWSIRPSTKVPIFRTTASLEMWVHGGDLTVNGSAAHANCFIVVEPGQEVAISSGFGARVLSWIEGPAEPVEFDEPNKLFGY